MKSSLYDLYELVPCKDNFTEKHKGTEDAKRQVKVFEAELADEESGPAMDLTALDDFARWACLLVNPGLKSKYENVVKMLTNKALRNHGIDASFAGFSVVTPNPKKKVS